MRGGRMMQWSMAVAAIGCLVVGVACLPVEVRGPPALELMPPKVDDGLPTLATDLLPPPLPEETTKMMEDGKALETRQAEEKKLPATLFLINVYALKNQTAEDANDVLHDDVIGEVPESAEPLAMFLLVVEDEDEDHPVSLDEVARDLEEEGFSIEKVEKDGETRVVKVDLGSVEVPNSHDSDKDAKSTVSKAIDKVGSDVELIDDEQPALEESNNLMKIRRKRHICLKCKLQQMKAIKHRGGGGGCGGGCGGGGYYQPAPVVRQPIIVPVVIVPVQVGYKKPSHGGGGGGYYRPPQQQHQPNSCNVCNGGGGGGYGGHGGGGYSYAQASASASSYG